MIVFRKLGAFKVAYEVAISIVAPLVILACFYAVTRIPLFIGTKCGVKISFKSSLPHA